MRGTAGPAQLKRRLQSSDVRRARALAHVDAEALFRKVQVPFQLPVEHAHAPSRFPPPSPSITEARPNRWRVYTLASSLWIQSRESSDVGYVAVTRLNTWTSFGWS